MWLFRTPHSHPPTFRKKSPKNLNSKKSLGHQSIQKWPDMTSSLCVIYVSRHYWMFAVQITECVFSLKSLGLLTPTQPPTVWDFFQKKHFWSFFLLWVGGWGSIVLNFLVQILLNVYKAYLTNHVGEKQ